jgi:hypothetical protein
VFGTGLWIGGIADVDGDQNPDTVTVIGYDPAGGLFEYREGRVGQDPQDPLARVFDSRDSTDIAEWPAEFSDTLGVPIVLSQQDLVTIYNDLGRIPYGEHRLGIQVNQRSMAYTGKVAGTSVHAIYFDWTIVNMSDSLPDGPYTIEDMYIGFLADMDIGNTATEDMTSFIPVYNFAVAWDSDFREAGFQRAVGIIGFTFDEDMIPGSEVNFSFMSNPGLSQPRPDPDVFDDVVQYEVLACLNGQCEEHDIPTDIRFCISVGPVDIAPGESQQLKGVLFFADPFASPTELTFFGTPPRVNPFQPGMANFVQVALEMKESLSSGVFPSPFTIFETSLHEDTGNNAGPYTIHAGITDSIGLKEAMIVYSTDGGTTTDSVGMSESVILNYSGGIPGLPDATTVDYWITAVDSADVVLTDPPNAPDSTYSFEIPADTIPPASIESLSADSVSSNTVSLSWTAPGDDNNTNGPATVYDVRYSTAPIDSANFDSAMEATGEPAPGNPGTTDVFTVEDLEPETEYYFALKTADQTPSWSGISNVVSSTPSSIIDGDNPTGPGIPLVMSLNQNYPNPFNPMTVITFTVPNGQENKQRVVLEIFDTRGRLVKTLLDSRLEPGIHQISWDGRNNAGSGAGSGIYMYRLCVEERTITRKMVLLK